jgi:predicted MFS family arabinose efflux permease
MRERALKIVLVLVGLLFIAGIYFIGMDLWRPGNEPTGTMMLSLYVTLGIFLLLAARNPSAYRTLIAYAGWANIAHATVMALMAIHPASDRGDLLMGTAIFLPIGVVLLALAPAKQSGELASAAGA